MTCEYMFYRKEDEYFPRLYCKTDNKNCIYQKRCEKVQKFIPIENLRKEECYKFVMEKQKNIPKNSYFIQTSRKNKKGKLYLYVVINDKIEKILSDFESIDQCYVYLKKVGDKYKVSLTPFSVEKKQTVYKNSNSKQKLSKEIKEEDDKEKRD